MKIVQYMQGFRNADGGVVRAVIDLCNLLAQRGHEVAVLTVDDVDAPPDWVGDGRPLLRRLNQRIRGRDAFVADEHIAASEVVHLHVPWDRNCLSLARMAQERDLPYVFSIHGMLDDWTMGKGFWKKRAYLSWAGGRRMLERAAAVQCSTQVEAQQSGKWYPRGRAEVVPLLVDLSPFEHLPGPGPAKRRFGDAFQTSDLSILFVGRLHPLKRIEMLLDAAAWLRGQQLNVSILIAGIGEANYEQSLRSHTAALGIADATHFLGHISGADKLSLYQAADVLVHPSAHESFGLSMIEALACGTPVITTKAVNLWPELQTSGGASIVDQEPAAVASELKALIENRGRIRAQGQRGRGWVWEYLAPTKVLAQYESMYQRALGGK